MKEEITFPMIKETYVMRREIDNNGVTIDYAKSKINEKTGLSIGSANNYLNNLRCFMIGQVYSMQMKPIDTLYFLSQIYNDFSEEVYKKALSALEQHIDYACYELGVKTKNEKLLNDINNNKINIKEIISWYKDNNEYYPLEKTNINNRNWDSRGDITHTFPFERSGQFLKEKGFGEIYDKAMKIHKSTDARKNAIRRMYIICFLNENDLLYDFLDEHWLKGKTSGKTYIQYITKKRLTDVEKIAFRDSDIGQEQKPTTNFQPGNNAPITKPPVLIKASPVSKNDFFSEYYSWITKQAKNYFIQINDYRKENRKEVIFKEADGVKLWTGIEKLYEYSETFSKFADSLHGLFLENARDIIGRGKYKSRFPDSFVKNGTWTKEYIDDIKITRNKFAHNKSRDEIPEENDWGMKRTILDVYEKYLGTRNLPETTDDFRELQIGIMNQFKNVLRKLLAIVKNE